MIGNVIIIIITVVLYSAPSGALPALVKQNGLEGREERDGVINRYLSMSGKKPIPGCRASNREGMAQIVYFNQMPTKYGIISVIKLYELEGILQGAKWMNT